MQKSERSMNNKPKATPTAQYLCSNWACALVAILNLMVPQYILQPEQLNQADEQATHMRGNEACTHLAVASGVQNAFTMLQLPSQLPPAALGTSLLAGMLRF